MSNALPRTATMHVPSWLWGSAPEKFFRSAGFHARPGNKAKGTWQVRTIERHTDVAPNLVEVHHLAGPSQPRPLFNRLHTFAGPRLRGPATPEEIEILKRLDEQILAKKDLVDAFSLFSLQTTLANNDQLIDIVSHVFEEMNSFRFKEEPFDAAFPHAGVHVVRRRDELLHRIKLAGVLIRLEHDSRLAEGDLSIFKSAQNSKELIFSASENLHSGVTLLDAYFAPLLGALTPGVWAFHAAREIGLIIYSLGQPISGTKEEPAELIQLLPTQGTTEPIPFPTLHPNSCSEALAWWGARLDRLFGILSDPSIFTDTSGSYLPVKHIQGVSSAEQLFQRVLSLQVSNRDLAARRVLFFSALDTLERLTSRNLETHCSLGFAEKTLARLKREIPPAAAEVLIPGAERGVNALRKVQDGFFLLRQLGAPEIEITEKDKVVDRLNPEKAAAHYIKMLRNATHGFGSNQSKQIPYVNTLLAHHDGDLPQDLPLLAYLYLLDVLTQPKVVARALYRKGKTS